MYRNFSLTEKEKKQILEQHGRYGYKKPLKEGDDYQDYLDTNYSSDGMDDYHAEKRTEVYANTLFDIGKLLHQIGRKEEAEKYRQEAIQAGRSIWNDDDWGHYD